ncbi:hypothetical protein ACFRCI_42920 [Streptomyces sp. NPDC056638]|uniref:hypothetical protein n=1 Tax=Streptomyces sp. NPDC056638 TaxID=3345887 RepID=UPI00369A0152
MHGACADASSFAQAIAELLADGLDVVAPAVPNRSLFGDAAYIASVVRQIPGPLALRGSGTEARCSSRPGCSPGTGGGAVASWLKPAGIGDDGWAGMVFRCGGQGFDTS